MLRVVVDPDKKQGAGEDSARGELSRDRFKSLAAIR